MKSKKKLEFKKMSIAQLSTVKGGHVYTRTVNTYTETFETKGIDCLITNPTAITLCNPTAP